jgi:hypothetical protein
VDREALEEPDGIGVLDVAAVNEEVHFAGLEQRESGLDGWIAAVRVTEDADLHFETRSKKPITKARKTKTRNEDPI